MFVEDNHHIPLLSFHLTMFYVSHLLYSTPEGTMTLTYGTPVKNAHLPIMVSLRNLTGLGE